MITTIMADHDHVTFNASSCMDDTNDIDDEIDIKVMNIKLSQRRRSSWHTELEQNFKSQSMDSLLAKSLSFKLSMYL